MTAHLLALPAVVGGVVVFVELFRVSALDTAMTTGTALFGLLALAFLVLPGSRQHRGRSMLLRLIGLATIAGAVVGGLRLLGLTGWDPLLEIDPFGPHGNLLEEYSTRLAALFAVLTVVFYGYPKDR